MSWPPFILFTDYGLEGPYVGHLHLQIAAACPGADVIDLQHDVPPFRPQGGGLLLASQLPWVPEGGIVIGVVDPGVGTQRRGLILHWCGRRLIGPDNGLFAPLLQEAERIVAIDWMPTEISATFHGRDWFVPAALRLAQGLAVAGHVISAKSCIGHEWPQDLDEVVYVDRFGNLITGRRGATLSTEAEIVVGIHRLRWARTFGERPVGAPFWHVNALGLVELSVNQGSAAELLGLKVGDPVRVSE
ncbi:MAG: hypothetical protein D6720_06845 [Gammaproteobacteria bacterium]|nr:MAG: hypothetical protein D6720_06845 [Gammaproteobacteria bacterium]